MNDQERISRIRRLLDRFYDGTASPEEISELTSLFGLGSLPADLEAERRAFEMMAAPDVDAIDIPDGLEESLEGIMTEPRPSMWARLRPWCIGGAAAAVLLALVTVLTSPDDQQPFSVGGLTAETEDTTQVAGPDTVIVHPIVDDAPETFVAEQKAATPTPHAVAEDPYTEITDPNEAARIATDLLCMVSEKMRTSIDKTEKVATSQITSVQTILSKLQ